MARLVMVFNPISMTHVMALYAEVEERQRLAPTSVPETGDVRHLILICGNR